MIGSLQLFSRGNLVVLFILLTIQQATGHRPKVKMAKIERSLKWAQNGSEAAKCSNKVVCTLARIQFEDMAGLNPGGHGIWVGPGGPDRYLQLQQWDRNDDKKLDFEEVFARVKRYVTLAFEALDKNQDGSILDEAKAGSTFSKKIFEEALTQIFDFFDSNKDNSIGLDDAIFRHIARDRNGDGRTTLEDLIDKPLINLPGPAYNLYIKLDKNKDEKLSREEAENFLRQTLSTVDLNSDCHIEVDEVVGLLQRLKVTWDKQIAVRMILNHYLTLASQVVKVFAERGDADKDGQFTVEEMFGFNDFNIAEIVTAAGFAGVVDLPEGSISLLVNADDPLKMWLHTLQDLLDQPAYTRNYQDKKCKLSHLGAGPRRQDQDQGVDFKVITILALSSLLLISIILALFWVWRKSRRQVEDGHTQTDVKNEGLNDTYDTTYGYENE